MTQNHESETPHKYKYYIISSVISVLSSIETMRFSADLLISVMIQMLLTWTKVHSIIEGPTRIEGHIGEDAHFMWNTTNQQEILSVGWGIRKGNIPDPPFINVNGYTGRVNKNKDLDEAIRRRLEFRGDLKKGLAWFVLRNLTRNDTNEYTASISDNVDRVLPYPVRLVVKEKEVVPDITLNPPFSNIPINETQPLLIKCSAVGTPIPNVMWLRKKDDVMSHGVGNVIISITDVTRNDSGIYNCCATNNPNKPPVCKSVLVSVQYKPEIDVFQSTSTASSYRGTIRLYCLARGVPSPLFTWYDPLDRAITTQSRDVIDGSVLELVTTSPDSYGLYRCKAENILGYDEHFITVHQTGTKNREKSCSDMLYIQDRTFATIHLVVTSISVIGNIIMVLLFSYTRKKACFKDIRKNTNDQRVLQQYSFPIKTDGMEKEPNNPNTPHESPSLIPPNINNGDLDVSKEYAEPAFLVEEKLKDNPAEQHFLSESQCLYQQINDAGLHEYQSLQDEKEGLKPPSNLPAVTPQKHDYATLNYHKQEGSEYQSLDLYSSIQDEK